MTLFIPFIKQKLLDYKEKMRLVNFVQKNVFFILIILSQIERQNEVKTLDVYFTHNYLYVFT